MGMWKKNPNHLNKYKGTATEQDYKHNQLQQLLYSWTNDCSERKKKKLYINFHIYIYLNYSQRIQSICIQLSPFHLSQVDRRIAENIYDVNLKSGDEATW